MTSGLAGLIFGAVVALAVFLAAVRKWRLPRAIERDEIGYRADRPLAIRSYEELDDFVALARCGCGGLLDRIGEGSRDTLRVVRCACLTCEEDVDLFFELSSLHH